MTSLLVSPSGAYLDSLILPYSQYNQVACDRAFGIEGRMKPLSERTWNAGYAFHAFSVRTTNKEFAFSRRLIPSPAAGSNLSAVYAPKLQESLINGVLQGRKQNDPRGASALSNARMWKLTSSVLALVGAVELKEALQLSSYRRIKDAEAFRDRRCVKEETKTEALQGWVRNVDDGFNPPIRS